ncbi:hypothetical protein L1765_10665 [Microaerobacter geothermalis]|uniref:hypothetical protein n=1 Tax=Microaerobacter geothermalis TaxID=674972 RepID=UPI001F172E80|nr:hypothetical protein [Microaerobacter geothermalis]MCF6094427.1 hypothetical protein [Microaerobacter geothermalis]
MTKWMLKPFYQFLIRNGLIRENYLGFPIPVGTGVFIFIFTLVFLFLQMPILEPTLLILTFVIMLVSAGLGWIDDRFGNHRSKGIKGHFQSFIKRKKITTGFIKASGGLIMSSFVSFMMHSSIIWFLTGTLFMALMMNFINLLDLRPGRAIKMFWLLVIILFPFLHVKNMVYIWPTVMATILLYPEDIQGKSMLGDTGSNLLGAALGFWYLLWVPEIMNLILLLLLIVVHLYAEKHSISQLIQRNRWLYAFDQWGRD